VLIESPRHRPDDLALWRRWEAVDVWRGRRIGLKADAARAVLRDFAAAGPCYAGTSWGKDSTVVTHLAWSSGSDIPAVRVRIEQGENPDTDLARDASLAMMPGLRYSERIVRARHDAEGWYVRGGITGELRAITHELGGRYVSGIRAAESAERALRTLRYGESTARTCAPIARWSAADVWSYLAAYDLPVHPAYACTGGGRWNRDRIRVGPLAIVLHVRPGEVEGEGHGRLIWEREYYGAPMA